MAQHDSPAEQSRESVAWNDVSEDRDPTQSVDSDPGDERGDPAQALVRSILDGLQEPTLVVDEDGRITHVNDRALELYDTTEAEAVGDAPHDLQAEGSEASDIVSEALARGEDIQQRAETVLVGDTETPLERTVTQLSDETGTVTGAMLVDAEVTEHRRQREKTQFLETYQRDVLDDLQGTFERLAAGDLTIDPTVPEPAEDYAEAQAVYEEFLTFNDHIGRATDNIRSVVGASIESADDLSSTSESLSANSEEVTASIQQIDAGSTELASGADDLADQSQRASETVDDLSASIEEITATLQEIDAQSESVADIAETSVDDASVTVEQIRDATTATSTVAERIDSLEDSMAEVGDIIDIIADIADQTNILALNANIEAARAGDAGDGFAVVAEEVKSLAEQSQDSADEIVTIIESVQHQTSDLVESIEDANDEVEQGADEVDDLADRLETIDERIGETSQGVGEISDAVESQAENTEVVNAAIEDTAGMSEEITASIQQISGGVDEQATAMEEVAANAQELAVMSDRLHDRVALFKVDSDESADLDDLDDVDV
ncbi:methyl-accepting chemotaxis protein [Halococcoides cellulosivorans]|uniref:PAS domain-containing protein n=1 Tax=Halococcoides cellulosivorans TaxID=1679096 RepID=A0A2R4X1P4_9EURY|nr:methyl-accepting chemotaxis protein [Halococcoides cellulosivorans]AWB27653.1 hypothetical protein HARCEL1_07990 [Halococcoides cellulosivorans]